MLTQIQSELKKKNLGEVYDAKLMQGLASEEAQAIIEERETGLPGAGPVAREARKRVTLAEQAPIKAEQRATLGVPADIKTYMDVVKKGLRLLTPKDKENVDRIESIVLVMDQLQKLADQIFTSKPDYLSRVQHGAKLKWEVAKGTDLGIAAQNYGDMRETVVRLLLELVGESGGRFTDKDMQQIQKAIPEIEGLIGDMLQLMPESKKVASNKFANMDELLFRKLSFIKTPQMVKMEQPTKEFDFEITKDKKVK
jgi:hypothetical protein